MQPRLAASVVSRTSSLGNWIFSGERSEGGGEAALAWWLVPWVVRDVQSSHPVTMRRMFSAASPPGTLYNGHALSMKRGSPCDPGSEGLWTTRSSTGSPAHLGRPSGADERQQPSAP